MLSRIVCTLVEQLKRRVSRVKRLLHNLLWVWVESENEKTSLHWKPFCLYLVVLLQSRKQDTKSEKHRRGNEEHVQGSKNKTAHQLPNRKRRKQQWLKKTQCGGRWRQKSAVWWGRRQLTGARSESWRGNTAEGAEISGREDGCRSNQSPALHCEVWWRLMKSILRKKSSDVLLLLYWLTLEALLWDCELILLAVFLKQKKKRKSAKDNCNL